MTLVRAIADIESAEELFELLDERYDEKVLRVYRVHILKRFGRMVAGLEAQWPDAGDEQLRPHYAKALRDAHDMYAQGADKVGPLVFKRPKDLVQLRVASARS
jgi:hypothetical protein